MGAHRYVLEVGLSSDQKVRFVWSQALHGAPCEESLHRVVDSFNLSREREELGRRPWWWARILDRDAGTEIAYYRPAMHAIGRRTK